MSCHTCINTYVVCSINCQIMVLDLCFNAKVEDAEINGINEYLGISKDYDIEKIGRAHV